MLHALKNAITRAPGQIYSGASHALKSAQKQLGAFHTRSVQPRLDSLKTSFQQARAGLKTKYEHFRDTKAGSDTPTNASKSFSEELERIQQKLNSEEDSTNIVADITRLTQQARDMKDLAKSVRLMDHVLGDGQERDLKGFREALFRLPFLKDKMGSLREHLDAVWITEHRSYESLHPELRNLLNTMALEGNFDKIVLKGVLSSNIEDLPGFILRQKDAFPANFNVYSFQNALECNKNVSKTSVQDLIATKAKFLELADKESLSLDIKNTVDQFFVGAITNSLRKQFDHMLPANLRAHLEATAGFPQASSHQDAVKWLNAEYANPDSKKAAILKTQTIAIEKLEDIQLALFQMNALKNLGLSVPKSITDDLLEQLGHIEKNIKFLEDIAQTIGIIPDKGSGDPLVALAGTLVKDIDALKQEAAKNLNCTVEGLALQAKQQLNIKQQASYIESLKPLLTDGIKPNVKHFIDLANANGLETIQNKLSAFFNSGLVLNKNPFSEDLSPIRFGKKPGELELAIIKEDAQKLQLAFTIHLGLDDNNLEKTALLTVPL